MTYSEVSKPLTQAVDVQVDVRDLHIRLAGTVVNVVDDVSFQVAAGELVGLVGESGSGKTTVALSLLGYTRSGLEVGSGTVQVGDIDMLSASPRVLQRQRGANVAYVPQDPASALNPALRVGTQLNEILRAHPDAAKELGETRARVAQTLEEAGLSDIPDLLKSYPHQLSGGQQQRVGIAMAFLLRPKVIVLDEPTTGLDVTTQRRVLDTVRSLCRSHGVATIYVSHDLAVVGGLVDTMIVLYSGRIVERGPTAQVFTHPAHPYTERLLRAVPLMDRPEALQGIPGHPPRPAHRPTGCQFAARCELAIPECSQGPIPLVSVQEGHVARCIRTERTHAGPGDARASRTVLTPEAKGPLLQVERLSAKYGTRRVLLDVDLIVQRNQTVAVVGESGSGKTTLARCLVGLHGNWSGDVRMSGTDLVQRSRKRPTESLRDMQYIFQNPYTALNPRKTIGRIVEQPLLQFYPELSRSDRDVRISNVLSDVSLSADFWDRYPDQLSGGERQRVAIARALVVEPKLLVCDEITSALDVSVQATIVELLRRLQSERDLSLVFITHNLALVRSIAQQAVVLSQGRVVESGAVADIFERPQHPYTVRLMQDAPRPDAGQVEL